MSSGTASLRVDLDSIFYAQGSIELQNAFDLTYAQAITFYAKASSAMTIDQIGFGNADLSIRNFSPYTSEIDSVQLTTDWVQYTIPIPRSSVLTAFDQGVFYYFTRPGTGSFWLDNIELSNSIDLFNGGHQLPQPSIRSISKTVVVNDLISVDGLSVDYPGAGPRLPNNQPVGVTVVAGEAYFAFTSSDPTVVATPDGGDLVALAPGSAVITASIPNLLGGAPVTGSLTLNVVAEPSQPAPAPTATSGVALLSNVFSEHPVSTWYVPNGDKARLSSVSSTTIGGVPTEHYHDFEFAQVAFSNPSTLDVSAYPFFHMDVWVQTSIYLTVMLEDFGADGQEFTADDSTITYANVLIPAQTWFSIDQALSAAPANLRHMALMTIYTANGTGASLYVENVYFHP
jgi:hypothetical protein